MECVNGIFEIFPLFYFIFKLNKESTFLDEFFINYLEYSHIPYAHRL